MIGIDENIVKNIKYTTSVENRYSGDEKVHIEL